MKKQAPAQTNEVPHPVVPASSRPSFFDELYGSKPTLRHQLGRGIPKTHPLTQEKD